MHTRFLPFIFQAIKFLFLHPNIGRRVLSNLKLIGASINKCCMTAGVCQTARNILTCNTGGGWQSRVQYVVMFWVWHADQWPADDAVHFSKDPKHVTGQYRWQGSPLSDRDCTRQWLYSGWSAAGTFLCGDKERDGGTEKGGLAWQSLGSGLSDPWPIRTRHNASFCDRISTPNPHTPSQTPWVMVCGPMATLAGDLNMPFWLYVA